MISLFENMYQQIDTLQTNAANLSQAAEISPFSFNELLFFVVSLIATFVSANNNLKPSYKTYIMGVFFVIAIIYLLIQSKGEINGRIYIYGILFVVLSFFIYRLSARSDFRSRKTVNKDIIKFTKQADTKKEIKLFGGDVDFFGNVDDNSISTNAQYKQLKDLNFQKIHILCIKPNNDKDELRIGFLLKNFDHNIKIRFFDDLNCDNCNADIQNQNDCSVQNIVKTNRKHFHSKNPYCKNPCNNPDLSIRGRIITKSNNTAESVAVIIKYEAGKEYIFKKYNREDKECSLYLMLWDVWWNKCAKYSDIQNQCKNKYEEYLKNNKPTPEPKSNIIKIITTWFQINL